MKVPKCKYCGKNMILVYHSYMDFVSDNTANAHWECDCLQFVKELVNVDFNCG